MRVHRDINEMVVSMMMKSVYLFEKMVALETRKRMMLMIECPKI